MNARSRSFAVIFTSLLLSACSAKIQHGLSEQDANQIKSVLEDNGISATTELEGGRDAKWVVEVSQSQASEAVRILRDNNLPRQEAPGLAEVFSSGSVVPSATEEKAMFMRALSGEVARMLEGFSGVVSAKVIVVPTQPSHFGPGEPARASVFIKARSDAATQLTRRRDEIQQLVAGAVPGLAPAQVAVIFDEVLVTPRPAVVEHKDRSAAMVVAVVSSAVVALLVIGLVLAVLRGRKLRLALAERESAEENESECEKAPTPKAAAARPNPGASNPTSPAKPGAASASTSASAPAAAQTAKKVA
jgi:type III secretion protein J